MEHIIIKYLEGKVTKEEYNILLNWLESDENKVKFKNFVQLQYHLNSIHLKPSEINFSEIETKIKTSEQKKDRKISMYFKYAAIFIAFLSVFTYSYYSFFQTGETSPEKNWVKLELNDGSTKYIKPNSKGFINSENGFSGTSSQLTYSDTSESAKTELTYNTLTVPRGQTFSIDFSDGTEVQLNAGSTLRYPTIFVENSPSREVYLDGEAFFDVSKNTDQPFIVNTEKLKIKVLGTRFNVNAYLKDNKPFAVLLEGSIQAENPINNESLKIIPGKKVFYKENSLKSKEVNTALYTGWIDGKLIFNEEPFSVIKNKLEREYNVEIINKYKPLSDIVITAKFQEEDIDKVLRTFKAYKDFSFEHNQNQIVITQPKG